MKKFALIGAAGYIAPRHLKAIKETGNDLVAALDKHDSVGILDAYFPEADFFTEFERFDRHIEKMKRQGRQIDYVVVCSPNYLHDAHIRFGLRIGADVICEKPVVLNPWNVEALMEIENETKKKVSIIHQLRLHPAILALQQQIANRGRTNKYDVQLNYITPRGKWYHSSWKGDIQKSGGVITNIGLHFFDVLLWLFGQVRETVVLKNETSTVSGRLELENATVNWLLSIDVKELPAGSSVLRSMTVNGEEIKFDRGFTELHTEAYKQILAGGGVGLIEALPSIELIHKIRNTAK